MLEAKDDDPNRDFYEKAVRTLKELFEKARAAQELHFAMALMPEFRGAQDGGWNTAEECVRAYDEDKALLEAIEKDEIVRLRVVLGFYLHVAEGAGFYEIPKKMMLTLEGKGNNIWPFFFLELAPEQDVERGVSRVRLGPFDCVDHDLRRIDGAMAALGSRCQPIIVLR